MPMLVCSYRRLAFMERCDGMFMGDGAVLVSGAGVNICQGVDAGEEAGESAVAVTRIGARLL